MFEFFRAWLIVLGAGMAVGGVALATLANTPLLAPLIRLMELPFWPSGTDRTVRDFRTFVFGVCGGVLAAWGVTVAILVSQECDRSKAWVWWARPSSVALWFVLDTGRSVRHRVWANVAGNVALLVAVAIPLAGTFSEFH